MRLATLFLSILTVATLFFGCKNNSPEADAIFYNGVVYTVDSTFSVATAFAIKDGKIIATGSDNEIMKYESENRTDLKGRSVYPGFHDGHCHFFGYGLDLKKISLVGTTSFDAVIDTLTNKQKQLTGGWIFGRGWDQNDWEIKEYPSNARLDSIFPETPVFLLRIDGHAALVNSKAMQLAGINEKTIVEGGSIETKNGKATGMLIDAAVELVQGIIPQPSINEKLEALLSAQKNCFEVGLTMVTDAGLGSGGLMLDDIKTIDSLQNSGELQMRINAMASYLEIEKYRNKNKSWSERLQVCGFKVYGDGALGSRGALLKDPYSDKPAHYGFLIHSLSKLDSIANAIVSIGYQMNTHCIGDSAHKSLLDIYTRTTANHPNHRWRIEHAQVIDPADLKLYEKTGIIPSVQPVHATSDMYWAESRLGAGRLAGAYAYKDLLKHSDILISGSDFPVEHINPFYGFYAAVSRKDQKGQPEGGFIPEQKLTRQEALKSFTIWPAYGCFMENRLGSIEIGKIADFIILDTDIMQCPESDIWKTKVLETYIGGKKVFGRER
ncbi:MAG: amidohydrolase [Bacteroidota bacterium]